MQRVLIISPSFCRLDLFDTKIIDRVIKKMSIRFLYYKHFIQTHVNHVRPKVFYRILSFFSLFNHVYYRMNVNYHDTKMRNSFFYVSSVSVVVRLLIFIDSMCSAVTKGSKYSSKSIDVSILPNNVFDLKGDAFYTLVRDLTSEDVEDLLKLQRISSARCFLNTNPLTFLNIQTTEPSVIEIQARLSYKTTDDKNIVLAGITADILYLKQLLKLYLVKNEKKTIDYTDLNTTAERPSSIMAKRTTSSRVFVDRFDIHKTSINDHRTYLNQQIKSWWEKHRTDYNLEDHMLIEPDDYQLIINEDSAIVKCSCKQKLNLPLPRERKHYQLSNFYKHLTRNDQCDVIKKKCSAVEQHADEESDDANSSDDFSPIAISRRSTADLTRTDDQPLKRPADDSSNSSRKVKRGRQRW